MRRTSPHCHPCERCGLETVCDGDLERNFDGWPLVVCRQFHVDVRSVEFLCETCVEQEAAEATADALENV